MSIPVSEMSGIAARKPRSQVYCNLAMVECGFAGAGDSTEVAPRLLPVLLTEGGFLLMCRLGADGSTQTQVHMQTPKKEGDN
jgi:hypothetical protein